TLHAAERGENEPLVIAGGHCAFNPEPLAPFIDAFGVGDGEDLIVDMRDCWTASAGLPRSERLRRLAQVEGVYVPQLYEVVEENGWLIPQGPRVTKRNVADLNTTF